MLRSDWIMFGSHSAKIMLSFESVLLDNRFFGWMVFYITTNLNQGCPCRHMNTYIWFTYWFIVCSYIFSTQPFPNDFLGSCRLLRIRCPALKMGGILKKIANGFVNWELSCNIYSCNTYFNIFPKRRVTSQAILEPGLSKGRAGEPLHCYGMPPPKTNMETENSHIWKEVHFSNHHFVYLCWFSGVYTKLGSHNWDYV